MNANERPSPAVGEGYRSHPSNICPAVEINSYRPGNKCGERLHIVWLLSVKLELD